MQTGQAGTNAQFKFDRLKGKFLKEMRPNPLHSGCIWIIHCRTREPVRIPLHGIPCGQVLKTVIVPLKENRPFNTVFIHLPDEILSGHPVRPKAFRNQLNHGSCCIPGPSASITECTKFTLFTRSCNRRNDVHMTVNNPHTFHLRLIFLSGICPGCSPGDRI